MKAPIKIKKQEKMEEKITLPEGFSVESKMDGEVNVLTIKGKGKENSRRFILYNILINVKGNEIILSALKNSRNEKKMIGSTSTHIRKMISGLEKDFVYKMEICNVHFPMVVKVEGQILSIKNFLGEKVPRTAKIKPSVKLDINGNIILVSSQNKDDAGETVSNIEIATKIRNRDRRVFQDGIFLIEKPVGEKK